MKKHLASISVIVLICMSVLSINAYAETRKMNINFVACNTKDHTVTVNRWLGDGDRQAVALEVMNGNCEMLPAGTVVYVEKHGIEWAQVRQKGSNTRVYVLEKFLQ